MEFRVSVWQSQLVDILLVLLCIFDALLPAFRVANVSNVVSRSHQYAIEGSARPAPSSLNFTVYQQITVSTWAKPSVLRP